MYIAMNRFKVRPEDRDSFRDRWINREILLDTLPGFLAFHLLEGPARQDHILFSSHTVWRSRADFDAWTQSEQFRIAHSRSDRANAAIIGHPELECFEVLQEIRAPDVKSPA